MATATLDRDPNLGVDLATLAAAVQMGDAATAREILDAIIARNIAAALADVEQAEGTPDDDRSRTTRLFGRTVWSWKPRKVRAALGAVTDAAGLIARITGPAAPRG